MTQIERTDCTAQITSHMRDQFRNETTVQKMCLKAENGVHLGEFQLDQTLGVNSKGTGTVLWTRTDGAFEEYLPDRSNTIHQDLQRHCCVAMSPNSTQSCGILVLAAMSRRDVGPCRHRYDTDCRGHDWHDPVRLLNRPRQLP